MKKFILAALAATLVGAPIVTATPALAQQSHRTVTTVREDVRDQPGRTVTTVRENVRDQHGRTVVTRHTVERPQVRSWRKGQRFDSRYAQDYRQIDYRQYRQLKAPPRGYHWVRSGNDAVLVGVTSGIIAAVLAGTIR